VTVFASTTLNQEFHRVEESDTPLSHVRPTEIQNANVTNKSTARTH